MRMHRALGALVLVWVWGSPPLAYASDLRDVFATRSAAARIPTQQLLAAARRNRPIATGRMRLDIVRRLRSGRVEREVFVVLRRRIDGELRILTDNRSGPAAGAGRVLQIEEPGREIRAFAFVRAVSPDPFATSFRLADPFLCTWYDAGDSAGAAVSPSSAPPVEVVGRRTGRVEGDPVHLIEVRPASLRRFDRTELAIADADGAILEYRHFARPADREPALVVRAPRRFQVRVGDAILPGLLRYEDRRERETIEVRIEHGPLPRDLPRSAFEPETFHRVSIE